MCSMVVVVCACATGDRPRPPPRGQSHERLSALERMILALTIVYKIIACGAAVYLAARHVSRIYHTI